MEIKHILVPVDFSPYSLSAAYTGRNLAKRFGAKLSLIHVDPIPGFSVLAVDPAYVPPTVFGRMQRRRSEHLDNSFKELLDDLAFEETKTRQLLGEPAPRIIEFANEEQVDLIVMGSHGRSGASRMLLGSVAESVSAGTPCPVLVDRSTIQSNSTSFSKTLVGLDYGEQDRSLVDCACTFQNEDGHIEFMHVWREPFYEVVRADYQDDHKEYLEALQECTAGERQRLQKTIDSMELPGKHSAFLAPGNPAEEIARRAKESGAELVVVGCHSKEGISQKLLGTTAQKTIRACELPILMVPQARKL